MINTNFVSKVRDSLLCLGVNFEEIRQNKASIGLGISGGADSVSLFIALSEILKVEKIPLVCVHINHHIRCKEETDSDMNFVKELCRKYISSGFQISLDVYDLKEGEIEELSKIRKCGTEEAARFIRYESFEKSIKKNRISSFCLAHNQDDDYETILMRFLTGSVAGGIGKNRGNYVRPLLGISRKEIETFLSSMKQNYCIDSTNLGNDYLRNKVRHNLIPVLDNNFSSWRKALETGEEKRNLDNTFLDDLAAKTSLSQELFEEGKEALAYRVLVREFNKVGVSERIPFEFLKDMFIEISKALKNGKDFSKRFSCAEAGVNKNIVFVKRFEKNKTDFGFFDIIEKDGLYDFPFGEIQVQTELMVDSAKKLTSVFFKGKCVKTNLSFPFVIRNPSIGEKSVTGIDCVIEE
ncbi:MAG: tRNA lysidine(34) synthetase TilS [Treponema sp.]|nr:tRNA lysidine(34) synthetase TilS [Treponema sp.]